MRTRKDLTLQLNIDEAYILKHAIECLLKEINENNNFKIPMFEEPNENYKKKVIKQKNYITGKINKWFRTEERKTENETY